MDALLTTVCSGLLADLADEYYQGVTVAMWMGASEAMQQVVPPGKRGLAAALHASLEALDGKKRVLVQLNRAGVFEMTQRYASAREAAEHVQTLLRVEYERLQAGSHVHLGSLTGYLRTLPGTARSMTCTCCPQLS